MFAQNVVIPLTTDGSGNCTALSPNAVTGRVLAVLYNKGTLSGTPTVTVTTEQTQQAIVTLTAIAASANKYPRVPVHDETGTAATLNGTQAMREPVMVANERVKVTVSGGGATLAGTVTLVIG